MLSKLWFGSGEVCSRWLAGCALQVASRPGEEQAGRRREPPLPGASSVSVNPAAGGPSPAAAMQATRILRAIFGTLILHSHANLYSLQFDVVPVRSSKMHSYGAAVGAAQLQPQQTQRRRLAWCIHSQEHI